MPVVATIDDKILCMHGGLSPELISLDQLSKVIRPTDVPEQGKYKNSFSYFLLIDRIVMWSIMGGSW